MPAKQKKAFIVHKFRLYPTEEQQVELAQMFGNCRFLFNKALALCKESYPIGVGYPGKFTLFSLIPHYQESYPFLNKTSVTELRDALTGLDAAYQRFFAKEGGFPKFKKRTGRQSMTCSQSVVISKAKIGHFLKVEGLKNIPINLDKRSKKAGFPDWQPKRATISKSPSGEFYASISWQTVAVEKAPYQPTSIIGIDEGIINIAATSYGRKLENPRALKLHTRRLRRAQRALARKKKGSRNRMKARVRVAKIHQQITRTRKFAINSFIHHEVRKAARNNQAIAIQSSPKKPQLKICKLSKALSDAAGGYLIASLRSECLSLGVPLLTVSQWEATSSICHKCLHKHPSLTLKDRKWRCLTCGALHDRDVNAAKVIALIAGGVIIPLPAQGNCVDARSQYQWRDMADQSATKVRPSQGVACFKDGEISLFEAQVSRPKDFIQGAHGPDPRISPIDTSDLNSNP